MRAAGVILVALAAASTSGAERPLAQFYYVSDNAALRSLEANIDSIGLLSPAWIEVDPSGGLTTSIEPRVMELAAAHSVHVMPLVMNANFDPAVAAAVLREETVRSALAAKIARLVLSENFDGVQLDFEGLDSTTRDGYTALARTLAAQLSRYGKRLAVTVAAPVYAIGPIDQKPSAWLATPRSEGFDYAKLGAAADFVTLMAYDQYATADAAGPVAGFEWVDACIRKALEWIPAGKLTLGLPFYHRRWAGARIATGSWAEAQAEAIRENAPTEWHPMHQEPFIRFERAGVANVVWFHNAASLERRLELARRYGLRGFSAWRLGQEDPAVWPRLFERKGVLAAWR
ncbi:MAG: glycosyl hydrolase family 18 protein [Bryobacteraceae bacterium]